MLKEFIPYEQALELAKLNFNEKCFGYYGLENELYIEISCNLDSNLTRRNFIATPLYQQAFRWFIEKGLFYDIKMFGDWDKPQYSYIVLSRIDNPAQMYYYEDKYSYEEAELACLNKLIELAKIKS
jgi:hypothetical protein